MNEAPVASNVCEPLIVVPAAPVILTFVLEPVLCKVPVPAMPIVLPLAPLLLMLSAAALVMVLLLVRRREEPVAAADVSIVTVPPLNVEGAVALFTVSMELAPVLLMSRAAAAVSIAFVSLVTVRLPVESTVRLLIELMVPKLSTLPPLA